MSKKAKIITLVVIVLTGILIVAANVWRSHALFHDLRVHIDYQECDTLVTDTEVKEMVMRSIPDLPSSMIRDIDLTAVEKAAAKSPYLRQCEASTAIGGAVVIHAVQRRPIVRVVTGSREYYLDGQCRQVPISNIGTSDVIIASGDITPHSKGERSVWTLAQYLDNHPDQSVLFDQIYRDNHGILYLTPKLGNHIVEIGDTSLMEDKFERLMAMYSRGLPQTGWNTYNLISVRYRGQIIGRRPKRQNTSLP